MWLRTAFLLACILVCTLAEKEPKTTSRTAISIEEFVTSHKVPEGVSRPSEEDFEDDAKKDSAKDVKHAKKVVPKFESLEKKAGSLEPVRRPDSSEDEAEKGAAKRQVRVELENFSDSGVLHEDGNRRGDHHRSKLQNQKDAVIPGVYISAEYPTTMMPVLTTPREARGFDFVPVNIIREDSKDAYTSFSDRNFGDFGDVSLVPAGTNSRIQVKKGPNGKDYEYEYVYYYYDEEDESKAGTAGSSVTNAYDIPARGSTTASRRSGTANSNRGKYTSLERSSTVEPASNEVIPNRNGNRGRQLAESEEVSEERLPTNTRFPPRSRSNHNTGTTEPSRARGNRPRHGLDLVDSSSFRTHQEGPEFPQILPKGPVRFLGVTPNENTEEKPITRTRGRPQRIQEPAPVEEVVDEVPIPTTRRRPTSTGAPEVDVELSRGQPARPEEPEEEDEEEEMSAASEKLKPIEKQESEELESSSAGSSSTIAATTENPTTEYPANAMDKVALDLYAFLQQGQNNLVDSASNEANESVEITTIADDPATTDFLTTTEVSATTEASGELTSPATTSTTTTSTTTTTEATTTITTTTEPPTTTTQVPVGRGKFRRPGIGGPTISRNRFKSNGGSSTTTEAPEPTQRTRGRFGSNGSSSGGFKRPRPNHKQPVEEDTVQKETSSSANAEKPTAGRGRFRGSTGGRSPVSTSTAAPNGGSSSNGSPGISRPSFNKLNINRRRGRPTTVAPSTSDESQESVHSESSSATKETPQETVTSAPKPSVRTRLPSPGVRPIIRPGGRVNLRQKPGQTTTTTTQLPEVSESSVEEPAGEGTEEETHEAPAETSPPPTRSTTSNPLNKLRNRNRLQVHPKSTTRSPVTLAARRSPLLPRRKVTEPPVAQTSQEETSEEETSAETEATEATSAETSTAASTKHEETRGFGGLLASPRRRLTPRRPGTLISRE